MKRLSNKGARAVAVGIVALTAVLAVGVALWRVVQPREPHVELDRGRYPICGLDLSAHNGSPDVDSIAASGVDFVYLKASEGVSHRDPAFVRNYLAARRAGLAVGAYHFFRFDCDGKRQAINFLDAVKDCELQLPAAIDIEEWGNPAGYATEIINERIATMLAIVNVERGPVVIYTNKNGDARFVRHTYDRLDGSDPDLWICSFTDPPLTRRPWRLWQHSHVGKVAGVRGKVDLNTFNGSREQWKAWLDSIGNTIKQHNLR